MAVSPTNVLGKYRIIREIARSNDIVYEAVDPAMGRRVAIKELALPQHLAAAQKRERIERFYREAKAAGTLTHPNIVTIYDVGQENDRHFIAMEYLEGHSLREIHQMQGALPVKETIEIALQLCDALGFAHSKGIVHRDVKPDNVHILPGGIIKLTDFGIARITADPSITAQGQVFGTPSYMSPEQVASHTVDHRTDLFSLGITMYEMLTGRKPFVGDSVITITYNIMNIQPAMPVGVPPALHAILQKALAKDVNYRYQNAAAMAADLRAERANLDTSSRGGQLGYNPAPLPNPTIGTGAAPQFPNTMPQAPPQGMPVLQAPPGQGMAPPGNYQPPQQGQYAPQARQPSVTQYPTGNSYNSNNPNFTGRYETGGGGMSPQARSFIVIVISGICIVLLLVLMYWGISLVFHSGTPNPSSSSIAPGVKTFAKNAVDNGTDQDAVDRYEKLKENSPEDSANYFVAVKGLSSIELERGKKAQYANKLDVAEAAYKRAIEIYPHNAEALMSLGGLRQSEDDMQGAVHYWQEAANADAGSDASARGRVLLARYYISQGKLAQARGEINKARQLWQQASTANPGSDESADARRLINSTESR